MAGGPDTSAEKSRLNFGTASGVSSHGSERYPWRGLLIRLDGPRAGSAATEKPRLNFGTGLGEGSHLAWADASDYSGAPPHSPGGP